MLLLHTVIWFSLVYIVYVSKLYSQVRRSINFLFKVFKVGKAYLYLKNLTGAVLCPSPGGSVGERYA